MSTIGSDAGIPAHSVTGAWADMSGVPQAVSSWTHGGVVATRSGELIGFHAGQLVTFDGRGRVLRAVESGLTEGHGITLVEEGDEELLWICDPGFVFARSADDGDEGLAGMFGKGLHVESRSPRVVKVAVDGEVRTELPLPPPDPGQSSGMMGEYCPCGTAVDEERLGGTGDVWVADGYGSSLVHRFDKSGTHLSTLSGDEGAGRFNCPHSVYIDRRDGKTPELYIADRGNKRVQVYDLQGRFCRAFGQEFLNSPSGFAQWGAVLVVAELFGRLAALDRDDAFVGYIGPDLEIDAEAGWPQRPGWPNALSADGRAVAPPGHPDRFNSPHSMAVDANGNLFVSEWLLGGRYTKVTAASNEVPVSTTTTQTKEERA
jgi:hypothetical protein